VFFSSKIANSVLSYCDREGIEREVLYSQSDWPEEFLKDPSCWLESHKLEELLRFAEREICDIEKIALLSPKLHAWGPLDSVLKLMGKPQDILTQPDRFLTYFISPPPPVVFMEKNEESVSFRIPISNEEYPTVTRYLKAAFESLPVYVGEAPAQVVWSENMVSITWAGKQESMLEDRENHVNPKLVTNLMHSIEKSQKEIEDKNSELQMRLEEIHRLKSQIQEFQNHADFAPNNIDSQAIADSAESASNAVSKLQDYLVRAQQLITVLVGTERTNPIIAGALRKVDWDRITKEFPLRAREAKDEISKMKDAAVGERPARALEETSWQKSNPSTQEKFLIAEGTPQ
jgi:hypothetical protein